MAGTPSCPAQHLQRCQDTTAYWGGSGWMAIAWPLRCASCRHLILPAARYSSPPLQDIPQQEEHAECRRCSWAGKVPRSGGTSVHTCIQERIGRSAEVPAVLLGNSAPACSADRCPRDSLVLEPCYESTVKT